MSKREITLRHSAIIHKLKRAPSTLKEINEHLAKESALMEYNLNISARTFQRDIADILSIYNIIIECDKPKNRYYITDGENNELNMRMLEAFNIFTALNASIGLSEYLDVEQYAASGTEHFHGLLHAIKNNLQISIHYQSYHNDGTEIRTVQPYFLKEFKNRWYLIALDINKAAIRTFALDRIKTLEITKKKFNKNVSREAKSHFQNSFGIIAGEETEKLEPVLLSFNSFQGKYIKSLPLHPSQRIIKDNQSELQIELSVHTTFDLEMQILSYGENVKVISPISLKENIKKRFKNALAQYRD